MPGKCTLILASRGNELGRAIGQEAWDALAARFPGELELHKMVADDWRERVLGGQADVVAHRMEHLPTTLPEELTLAAVLPRRRATDALVSDFPFRELPRGARIATSNVRRRAMLLRARPDLKILETHVEARTRVQLWRVGDFDALVLATASLDRIGVDAPTEELDPNVFVPSPGQGAIGCVCKKGSRFEEFLAGIDDARTRTEVEVERGVFRALGGNDLSPVGVRATRKGAQVEVHAVIVSLDGRRAVALNEAISLKEPLYEADEFAERLKRMGGEILLEQARRTLG